MLVTRFVSVVARLKITYYGRRMKKLFPRYLFCKIGLLISTCVIDLSQVKILADTPPPVFASLWPTTPQSDLHNLLSDGDVFSRMDSNSRSSSIPSTSMSHQASTWNNPRKQAEQTTSSGAGAPAVFFSFDDYPSTTLETPSLPVQHREEHTSNVSLSDTSGEKQRLHHQLRTSESSPSQLLKTSSSTPEAKQRMFHSSPTEGDLPQNIIKTIPSGPESKQTAFNSTPEPIHPVQVPKPQLEAQPASNTPSQTITEAHVPARKDSGFASDSSATSNNSRSALNSNTQRQIHPEEDFSAGLYETPYEKPQPLQNETYPISENLQPSENTSRSNAKILTPEPAFQPLTNPPPKPQILTIDTPPVPKEDVAAKTPPKSSLGGKTILINFNNVSIIEFIRFISRISNKNFVFDEADLQFNVTIVSEEATTIENIMTALLQELRIHDLTLIEQGNNLIIHKNPKVNSVSRVVAEDLPGSHAGSSEIVTQVFRLNTLEPDKAAAVIRPLISENAILEFIKETNHLIVTDLHTNILEIAKLLKSLDAPNSGMVIGQYVAKSADIESLIPLVQQIMGPISKDSPLVFVPYATSSSIFIVSTPFLVERSLSMLEHLDQEKGRTQIIDLERLQYLKSLEEQKSKAAGEKQGAGGAQGGQGAQPEGKKAEPALPELPLLPYETLPLEGGTGGEHATQPSRVRPKSVGITEFVEEAPIPKEKIHKKVTVNEEFIPVPVSRSKFYIHKVQYRRGDALLGQIQQIANSMQNTKGNDELLNVISTADFLQDSKALIFTGTPEYLDKVRALVEELDTPLRQVYIEMLILDTTIDDALNYSVNWGTDFGGGNQAGAQSFVSGASPLPALMNSGGVSNLGGQVPNFPVGTVPTTPFNNVVVPNPTGLNNNLVEGFSLGVIGQHIIHKALGIEFNSIAGLVRALHTRTSVDIVLNPKIITEDNVPAQIFVGVTTPFKTQSISNEQGSILTNNFEYRDVGTSLQVTPHIHNSDLVTLEILEERSSLTSAPATTGNSNEIVGPTTNKNSTKTTIHVPNGFFVIISGMLEEDQTKGRKQVPCLGGIPIVGAAFSDKTSQAAKRNLMIFLRPVIIDTDEEFQNLTRHQQDVWQFKHQMPKEWVQETEEALDFLNIRRTINTDDMDDPTCHRFAH